MILLLQFSRLKEKGLRNPLDFANQATEVKVSVPDTRRKQADNQNGKAGQPDRDTSRGEQTMPETGRDGQAVTYTGKGKQADPDTGRDEQEDPGTGKDGQGGRNGGKDEQEDSDTSIGEQVDPDTVKDGERGRDRGKGEQADLDTDEGEQEDSDTGIGEQVDPHTGKGVQADQDTSKAGQVRPDTGRAKQPGARHAGPDKDGETDADQITETEHSEMSRHIAATISHLGNSKKGHGMQLRRQSRIQVFKYSLGSRLYDLCYYFGSEHRY